MLIAKTVAILTILLVLTLSNILHCSAFISVDRCHHHPFPIETKLDAFQKYANEKSNDSPTNLKQFLIATTAAITLGSFAFKNPVYAADINQGAKIFQNRCASCHIGGTNVIAKERDLTMASLEKHIGLDKETIQSFIQNSNFHRGALAFSGKLNDIDYEDVVAYVYDQAIHEKW